MTADRINSRATHPATPRHDSGRRAGVPPNEAARQSAAHNVQHNVRASEQAANTRPISAAQNLIALLAAPLAWLAQVAMAEMLLGSQCVAGSPLFVAQTMAWTPLMLVVASLICLTLGGYGTFIAWRNLWRTARIPWGFPAVLKGTRAERDWFMSRVCAMSSTMFMLGLLATDVAMLLIAPCSPW